jgi:hypothetical protein
VIDLSPYWRPRHYASAIVVVDAVVFHAADLRLLSTVADREFLVRALLFRLLAEPQPAASSRGTGRPSSTPAALREADDDRPSRRRPIPQCR